MKLSQVFEQLTSGELRNLKIGGMEEGEIVEENYRAVTNHIVLGLTTLYTRFNLKEGSIKVALKEDRLVYPLQSKYAMSSENSTEPVRYILDTMGMPFGDDILKIERVIAVDTDISLPLNDYNSQYSINTPKMDTISVPVEIVMPTASLDPLLKTTSLRVVYRAGHPAILPPIGYIDPLSIEIELPLTHLQALLYFVASRVNNPIGMTNEFNAGNNYALKYENECKRLEDWGLEIDTQVTSSRARRNGWM